MTAKALIEPGINQDRRLSCFSVMLGDVAGVSDLGALRPLSSQ
jgi:hypothetical protein